MDPGSSDSTTEEGLRLLSIDGGGIRGYSALLILQALLKRYKEFNGLSALPLPCEIFDFAGGTSTGGIIVILLFRLGMDIDNALRAYEEFAEEVFSEKKHFYQNGTYKASRLEQAVLAVISNKLQITPEEARQVKMQDDNGAKCFVSATPARNIQEPICLRTWRSSRHDPHHDITIVNAVRATSAAPTFFKSIDVNDETFVDGGLLCNNPTHLVLTEAEHLYPNLRVSAVVSLGTGVQKSIKLSEPNAIQRIIPLHLPKVFVDIATDCERVSRMIAQRFSPLSVFYTRLNVDKDFYTQLDVKKDFKGVKLDDWQKMDDVRAATSAYLKDDNVKRAINELVVVLSRRRPTLQTTLLTKVPVPP